MPVKMFTTFSARLSILVACLFVLPVNAVDNSSLDTEIKHLRTQWESIKFSVSDVSKRVQLMNALGEEADSVATKYPDRVEALIWDGIVTSERASMASAFSALGLAKRSRDILEKAYAMDPAALDAAAPTILGVLYYRVPGFPVAFGDTGKARRLFEEAVQLAPNGLDAWFFYGEFLYSDKDYTRAAEVLHHALSLPHQRNRPIWDEHCRLVIRELLAKIQDKS
ncbi:tetratricopeptide repeat protein [Beijerinckia indica]|uniref:Tetratricopeptide TPR_2 repeat protein n=1 Tax=Beijerinckia indica subsp. indica (strain ATCC 9039 / DSM 1715 / NCIMB 8712) TaxID=395963 RepID=B2IIY1_BEII9|nr:tetratricopeptide repeat protein [Beijerinckia indica]ACB96193.1 tetratricopeptide TPR_2 repeat protein [Beijerinckia indica subsp. indica ATCC 9039]